MVPHKNLTTVTPGLVARLLTASDPHLAPSSPAALPHQHPRTPTHRPGRPPPSPRTGHGTYPSTSGKSGSSGSARRTARSPTPSPPTYPPRCSSPATRSETGTPQARSPTGAAPLPAPWACWPTNTPDVPAALCALAGHQTPTAAPRLQPPSAAPTFTNVPMDRRQWEDLCYRADATRADHRHVNARRYIFTLLTGANLANTRHRLAFPTTSDKHNYLALFQRTITTPLRDALHDYAQAMLDAADINEPLTMESAPVDAPPRSPLLRDAEPRHRPRHRSSNSSMSSNYRSTPPQPSSTPPSSTSATHSDACTAPARSTRQEHPTRQQAPPRTSNTVAYRRVLPSRIHRSRQGSTHHRNQTGIHRNSSPATPEPSSPLTDARSMNKPIPIDPDWLREQSEGQQRSASDIAAELGLTPKPSAETLLRFGIARRPQGIGGMPSHSPPTPTCPTNPPRGRRPAPRLATATPSPADHRLPQHRQGRTSAQPAPRHTGQPDRQARSRHRQATTSPRPTQPPMSPTEHGHALLDLLQQPHIAQLLDRYAKPLPSWRPDDPRRSASRRTT